MKLICDFYKTAICLAVSEHNIEIVKQLVANSKIDLNIPYI